MIGALLDQIASIQFPTAGRVSDVLDADLAWKDENRFFHFYKADIDEGPFAHCELRLAKEGDKALVILMARAEEPVAEADLELAPLGDLLEFTVNPHIPPEGTREQVFQRDPAKVSVQLWARRGTLRSAAVSWGPS
ncbi:MAG: hypothetical protein AAGF12_36435 [Myxococcota bacterium]